MELMTSKQFELIFHVKLSPLHVVYTTDFDPGEY